MRTQILPLALTALLLFALPAQAEELSFGRLRFEFPPGWELVPPGAAKSAPGAPLIVTPLAHKNTAQLQVFQPTKLEDRQLVGQVGGTLDSVDQGRQIVGRVPLKNGGWFTTKEGVPVLAGAQKSKDAKGGERIAIVWGLAAGDHLYRFLLMCVDPKALPKLLAEFEQTVLKIRVVFPVDAGAPPMEGTPTRASLLHASYSIPGGLSLDSHTASNDALWHKTVVFSETVSRSIPFRVHLHSGTPSNARRLLVHWLLAADWSIKPTKGAVHKVLLQRDIAPQGSLPVSMVVVEVSKDGKVIDKRLGYLVHGKGWTVLVGAAHDMSKYKWLKEEWKEQFNQERTKSLIRAYAIASSVKIPKVKLTPRPDLDELLVNKKEHRWRWELNHTSGATTTYVEKHVYWSFFPDRSCNVDRNFFLGSSSLAQDPSTGIPTIGGMSTLTYEKGKGPQGRSLFMSFEWNKSAYLLVTPTSGLSSIHSLEPKAKGSFGDSKDFVGVAIDGRIEGEYSTGNDHKFRAAPKQKAAQVPEKDKK